MASIHRQVHIAAPAAQIWAALRDVGEVHTRVAPGFVGNCTLDGDHRVVTFKNGMQARELIVDVNDDLMRVSWSVVGGRLTHHNASNQVIATGERSCTVLWVADLLPNELAPAVTGMIEQGLAAMKAHQEANAA
jgi:carbon monoxide dehydrogenase subunit G